MKSEINTSRLYFVYKSNWKLAVFFFLYGGFGAAITYIMVSADYVQQADTWDWINIIFPVIFLFCAYIMGRQLFVSDGIVASFSAVGIQDFRVSNDILMWKDVSGMRSYCNRMYCYLEFQTTQNALGEFNFYFPFQFGHTLRSFLGMTPRFLVPQFCTSAQLSEMEETALAYFNTYSPHAKSRS